MPKVLKRDVDKAERDWASAVQRSINPDVDFAVGRARQQYVDLKRQFDSQKSATKGNPMPGKPNPQPADFEYSDLGPGIGPRTVTKHGITITGNPEGIPLKDVMGVMSDFLEYESEVVEAAAEDIEDPTIQGLAEDQAEAMEAAAESVDEAADAAAETAAEVFVETGIAATDNEDDIISGNALPPPAGETIMGNPVTGQDTMPGTSALVPNNRTAPLALPDKAVQGAGRRSGLGDVKTAAPVNTSNPLTPTPAITEDAPPVRMHPYKRPAKEWLKK